MNESGVVVDNNNGELKIKITSGDLSFCDKCSIKGVCNQDNGERYIILKTKENISEGTKIIIKTSEGFGIFLAFLIFLVPILIFIIFSYVLMKFLPYFLSYISSFFIVFVYYLFIAIFQTKLSSRVKIIKRN
ncbi:MAG: SoxR reducing system RseC family protein [Brevinematales bacterium]|nr:SoxR reducing system RseC family protein [Brevinematales bacterium]